MPSPAPPPPSTSSFQDSKAFRPWRSDLKWAGVFAVSGSALVYLAISAWANDSGPLSLSSHPSLHPLAPWCAGVGALFLLRAKSVLTRGMVRRTGKRIEERAAAELRRVFGGDAQVRHSVPVRTGGDADLVVDLPDGRRWVIEVKSNRSVRVAKRLFGPSQIVHTRTGKRLEDADGFLLQARRNAEALGGQAVLWFPSAAGSSSGQVDQALVVAGSARYLARRL